MKEVVRLVNLHFTYGHQNVKWGFKTVYDNTSDAKTYSITMDGKERIVPKDLGNKVFGWIMKRYPSKAIVIINVQSNDINIVRLQDHYGIYVGGKFAESCDTLSEARKAKQKWLESLKKH